MYRLIGYPILPGKCRLVAAGFGQTVSDFIYLFICQLAGTTALVCCGKFKIHREEGKVDIYLIATVIVAGIPLNDREASRSHKCCEFIGFFGSG